MEWWMDHGDGALSDGYEVVGRDMDDDDPLTPGASDPPLVGSFCHGFHPNPSGLRSAVGLAPKIAWGWQRDGRGAVPRDTCMGVLRRREAWVVTGTAGNHVHTGGTLYLTYFAKDETVLRQARILGGRQPYHPLNIPGVDDMWQRYNKDTGVFFPTEEAKKWSAEAMGLEAFPPVPKETKDAVLQDALLGTYRGPQYTERMDTLGVVRNYVRKEATWNSDAQRRIEEKVRSLLPGGRTGPAKAAGGASARA
ncbi:hypothetical protein NUW58_g8181 [Xylaria curta]|uniref:Uncharacterized protein n=1 Tax=Xylaria curta TaxID=42375 RepID=A0ACC1NAS3_9PEZI|nr:hypothetical protein NUW58_g8181 [Xylaria curta]